MCYQRESEKWRITVVNLLNVPSVVTTQAGKRIKTTGGSDGLGQSTKYTRWKKGSVVRLMGSGDGWQTRPWEWLVMVGARGVGGQWWGAWQRPRCSKRPLCVIALNWNVWKTRLSEGISLPQSCLIIWDHVGPGSKTPLWGWSHTGRARKEEARKGMLTWNFADMEKTLLFGTVPVFLSNTIRGIK